MEERLGNVIFSLAVTHESAFSPEPVALADQAANVVELQKSLGDATAELNNFSQEFAELPLRCTVALAKQWLVSACAYANQVAGEVMDKAASDLRAACLAVDAACPRWGDNLTDDIMRDDGIRIQLVMNEDIKILPALVRKLHQHMCLMQEISQVLSSAGHLEQKPFVREILRSAVQSIAFGKRTVNVAAAAKVALTKGMGVKSVEAVLGFRATLPASLLRRLEGLHAQMTTPRVASQAISAPLERSGAASSSSGLKRGRSGHLGSSDGATSTASTAPDKKKRASVKSGTT